MNTFNIVSQYKSHICKTRDIYKTKSCSKIIIDNFTNTINANVHNFYYIMHNLCFLNTKKQNVQLAIYSAILVLHIFENKYPNDNRPRKAIEAAERWITDPSEKNRLNCRKAAAAYAAATYAAYAADTDAAAAADAADAAAAATYAAATYAAAADTDAAATYAAYAAADAADAAVADAKEGKTKICQKILAYYFKLRQE